MSSSGSFLTLLRALRKRANRRRRACPTPQPEGCVERRASKGWHNEILPPPAVGRRFGEYPRLPALHRYDAGRIGRVGTSCDPARLGRPLPPRRVGAPARLVAASWSAWSSRWSGLRTAILLELRFSRVFDDRNTIFLHLSEPFPHRDRPVGSRQALALSIDL